MLVKFCGLNGLLCGKRTKGRQREKYLDGLAKWYSLYKNTDLIWNSVNGVECMAHKRRRYNTSFHHHEPFSSSWSIRLQQT